MPFGLSLVSATGTVPGRSATDNFDTPATPADPGSYRGGSGWTTFWIDDDDNNPLAGRNDVVSASALSLPAGFSSPNVLRYRGNNSDWMRRGVDLSGATSATVSFLYHRSSQFNNSNRAFNVELCLDNASCVSLGSVSPTGVNAADAGWTTFSWTGSSNLAANAFLRLGNGTDLNNPPDLPRRRQHHDSGHQPHTACRRRRSRSRPARAPRTRSRPLSPARPPTGSSSRTWRRSPARSRPHRSRRRRRRPTSIPTTR
jgi:hypothetical protein